MIKATINLAKKIKEKEYEKTLKKITENKEAEIILEAPTITEITQEKEKTTTKITIQNTKEITKNPTKIIIDQPITKETPITEITQETKQKKFWH